MKENLHVGRRRPDLNKGSKQSGTPQYNTSICGTFPLTGEKIKASKHSILLIISASLLCDLYNINF